MNDRLQLGNRHPAEMAGRVAAEAGVAATPAIREDAPAPSSPGDRTAIGSQGNGRATPTALFVTDLPPAAMLMGSQLALQMAAEIAAAQHSVMPPTVRPTTIATSVSVTITSGNIGVAAAMLPEQLIGELSAGTMHLSEEVLRAGAAVLQDGGIGMRSAVIASNLEAVAVAAQELPHVPKAYVQVVVFDVGVREMAVQEAEIGHENLTAQAAGAAPMELVVDVPAAAPAATVAPPPPTPVSPEVANGPVGRIIARIQGSRPAPSAAPAGSEQVRVRAGGSAISRMHAFARAYSQGDEQKYAEFQAAAIQAATTGLRLDDPKFGRVAAFLAGLSQRHGDKLGSLIQVSNGVVRLDSTAVTPAQLQRLLRHNSGAETIALEGRKLARSLPDGQQAIGRMIAKATSAQGLDLADPKDGQAAQQLAAILTARPELADVAKVQNGRLLITLPADEAQTLVEYFDYLESDDLPESVRRIRDANTAAIETSSRAQQAFESAQVFLTVYSNLERGQEAAAQRPEGHGPPRDDDDGDTPPLPGDDGGDTVVDPLPPPPAPEAEPDTAELERNARTNQRHQREAAAALNESLLQNAQGERFLDDVKSGVKQGAASRLAAIQQRLEIDRQSYQQALVEITEHRASDKQRRQVTDTAQSPGAAAPVAFDRENNPDYSRPLPATGN